MTNTDPGNSKRPSGRISSTWACHNQKPTNSHNVSLPKGHILGSYRSPEIECKFYDMYIFLRRPRVVTSTKQDLESQKVLRWDFVHFDRFLDGLVRLPKIFLHLFSKNKHYFIFYRFCESLISDLHANWLCLFFKSTRPRLGLKFSTHASGNPIYVISLSWVKTSHFDQTIFLSTISSTNAMSFHFYSSLVQ